MSNATASTHHAAPTEGAFPSRGRVSMFCLIAAEAARFSIFVLAYLFYIGKKGCDRAIPNPNRLIKSFAYQIKHLLKNIILLYSPGSHANELDAGP